MAPGEESFDTMVRAMSGALEQATVATAPAAEVESAIPTDEGRLLQFLRAGSYQSFGAAESAAHPSRGPHTRHGLPVRVFMDPLMSSSFREGREALPAGAGAVKEMYSADGVLEGWAVMVKTGEESAGGRGWYWYEVTSTHGGTPPVAAGNGVPLCFGCHSTGNDFVLTHFPLE